MIGAILLISETITPKELVRKEIQDLQPLKIVGQSRRITPRLGMRVFQIKDLELEHPRGWALGLVPLLALEVEDQRGLALELHHLGAWGSAAIRTNKVFLGGKIPKASHHKHSKLSALGLNLIK